MTNKRRRMKGTGSVYTRKDGRVVGEYEVNGKTKYVYGRDEGEVADKVAEAIKNRDAGFDSENLITVAYLDWWLNAIEGTMRAGSWAQYEQITRLHLKPALDKTKLDKINALQLQNLYRDKLNSGLSPRRVRYVHVTIHKALKDAVKWRLIPYNVAEACTPPKLVKKELRPLDAEQAKNLLTKAKEIQPKFYALYVLAVTTGMRQGELLGLKWEDIDLDTGTLQVRRSVFNGQVRGTDAADLRRLLDKDGFRDARFEPRRDVRPHWGRRDFTKVS